MACLATLLFCDVRLSAQSNVGFQYFYDDLGQLTKVVDSTGTVIEYVYDSVGNILQIKRSTTPAGMLAIFSFTPQSGAASQTVTIQGQGFDSTPASDLVQFNGAAAPVLTASASVLTVTVPPAATTGLISVTVSGQTATSTNSFRVVSAPVIKNLSCKSALFNKFIPDLQASGFNLSGATFGFVPAFSPPPITIVSASSDPSGASAIASLQVGSKAGTFALVATTSAGSSDALASPVNRFTVVDPLSNADSSGNGFPDVMKAAFCLDPLDPSSIPPINKGTFEADSLSVSLLNGVAPPHASPSAMEADSFTLALLNGIAPVQPVHQFSEADSLTVSLVNGEAPPRAAGSTMEADSVTVSLLNGTVPPTQPTIREADSLTVSLSNSAPKTGSISSGDNAAYVSVNQRPSNFRHAPNSRKRLSAKPGNPQSGAIQ